MKYEDIAQDMQGLLGGRADAQPSRRTALRAALGPAWAWAMPALPARSWRRRPSRPRSTA
jgi:hypothetical protein